MFKNIFVFIVIVLLLLSGVYFFFIKKPKTLSGVPNNNFEEVNGKLDLLSAIPNQLIILEKNEKFIIAEGDFKGLKYKVSLGKNLNPTSECYTGDDGFYYNPNTKKQGAGWFSISADEHKSGEFLKYNCYPEESVKGYLIPIISSEHEDLYGGKSSTSDYLRKQNALIMMSTIKNNLYKQISSFTNTKYLAKDLDKYGNILESIFKSGCSMPSYNGVNLLNVGPNSGGCSPLFWQDSSQNSDLAGLDPLVLDLNVQNALYDLLTSQGCKEGYVANYLEKLSLGKEYFSNNNFINKLSCAGKIEIKKMPSYSH